METVNIRDAKTRLSQLIDRAAGGEDVIVSRKRQAAGAQHTADLAEAADQVRPAQRKVAHRTGFRRAVAGRDPGRP
jgi:antitoxin (DNA-binding transcriptional repressor) of toxin-antitoxin stability system